MARRRRAVDHHRWAASHRRQVREKRVVGDADRRPRKHVKASLYGHSSGVLCAFDQRVVAGAKLQNPHPWMVLPEEVHQGRPSVAWPTLLGPIAAGSYDHDSFTVVRIISSLNWIELRAQVFVADIESKSHRPASHDVPRRMIQIYREVEVI